MVSDGRIVRGERSAADVADGRGSANLRGVAGVAATPLRWLGMLAAAAGGAWPAADCAGSQDRHVGLKRTANAGGREVEVLRSARFRRCSARGSQDTHANPLQSSA